MSDNTSKTASAAKNLKASAGKKRLGQDTFSTGQKERRTEKKTDWLHRVRLSFECVQKRLKFHQFWNQQQAHRPCCWSISHFSSCFYRFVSRPVHKFSVLSSTNSVPQSETAETLSVICHSTAASANQRLSVARRHPWQDQGQIRRPSTRSSRPSPSLLLTVQSRPASTHLRSKGLMSKLNMFTTESQHDS